jgi:hypothetical protein
MSYVNGPPTVASITCPSWVNPLSVTTPFTSASSAENTAYPASKDSAISYTLVATNVETDSELQFVVFRNYISYGVTTKTDTYDSTDVVALTGILSSSPSQSGLATNAGSGQYVLFAYPLSYTSIHATGFLFNGVTCPFTAFEVVSVTNSAGFTENYKVYRSSNPNIGNSTLTTSTSSNLINRIYWGISDQTSLTESQVEALANSAISNTKGRTFTVVPGVNDYIYYALPVRAPLGAVTFTVGGFEGGFESPSTVSITNVNGYTENYYVYRSTNKNLGSTTVVVS